MFGGNKHPSLEIDISDKGSNLIYRIIKRVTLFG